MSCRLTFVCISSAGLKYVDEVVVDFRKSPEIKRALKDAITITSFYIGEARDHSTKHGPIRESILASDFVFLDLMGADSATVNVIEGAVRDYQKDLAVVGSGTEYLRRRTRLGAFAFDKFSKKMGAGKNKAASGMRNMDLDRMMKMAAVAGKVSRSARGMHDWLLLQKAWTFAGFENIRNMILLVLKRYCGMKDLPAPGPIVDYSDLVLFDPRTQTGYKRFDAFRQDAAWDDGRPTVGLLYSLRNYPYHSFGIVSQIMDRLAANWNVVPMGVYTGEKKFARIEKHLAEGLKLDVVWDFLPFRFGAGPMGGNEEAGLSVFRQLGVPVLHPFFMNKRKIEDWKERLTGFGPAELIIGIMLPELDGVVDTIPIAGLESVPSQTIPDLSELTLIPDRFDKIEKKSTHYVALRRKNAKDKKVAFILYNYPPGEASVGGGAFLDTFQSVENICRFLGQNGYAVGDVTAKRLEATFMDGGCCNTAQWSKRSEDLLRVDRDTLLPKPHEILKRRFLERSTAEWGDPTGTIMADGEQYFIPGIIDKNIFIGLQPSRGRFEDPAKNYHDKVMPPQHQYTAFYQWLEEDFGADAIVHVGTHGSLEFLPGKESGMSADCYPDYLIGTCPHFYYYYTGNPSEAIIAKRRTHACLVSYSGPAFKRSGAYGDILALEELIADYEAAASLAPVQQKELYEKIIQKAEQMKLIADEPHDVDAIAGELIRMKTSLMPLGLHRIGAMFSDAEKASFLSAILSWQRGDLSPIQEIIRPLVEAEVPPIRREERACEIAETLVADHYFGSGRYAKDVRGRLSPEQARALDKALAFGQVCLQRLETSDELGGLLRCLEGRYLDAHLGGDVLRDPEVFPTGFNMFQFDARLVPSEVAVERGRQIAESTLAFFLKDNGRYPETVSLVLWGLETSKTKGETIGQILHYLGVKIIPTQNAFEKKFALVSLEELGRPRIDVVMTICGFFRDMFPNMIDFLDEVVDAVCTADEPDEMNFMKKHADRREAELSKQMDQKEAAQLSRGRIFGPPEGQYGTGLTTMIENRAWTDESEIAEGYVSAQKHLYTRTRRGEAQRSLFESNLKQVEVVSQVRSSVDYSITDLDHYYEYFGGLSKAVGEVRGEMPVMLYTDSSSSKIYTDEAGKAVQISVRTRLLNPEYINGLLEHGVHGAQHLADRVENLVGLSATTGRVESWIFSAVKGTLLDDRKMFEKLSKNNIYAVGDIIQRLFEAQKRGYWDASEAELDSLRQMYLDLEGDMEERTDQG
ncbi:magnesium chelatase subunit H [Desulfosarcina ovata subsp. sediminis]|uniref:Magnesium chelatase subunit H n=1 Tax=Desulfosarcina ovata subsp. sediminis TaxID=885957 RepID=A0A5K7ZMW7_9BACT|nr:magnesium chelatase subunit H [Desulfosarcina ovata]BBO82441.1 magnesium chelatase subunit H [Desulfosarcina ovata subsp. sediminis]